MDRRRFVFWALVWALCLAAGLTPAASRADSGDIGFEGNSFAGTGNPTGTKRPASVLWWNDDLWWANMWDTVSADFHIYRLNTATETWVDTGVRVDPRPFTTADTLWDGTHLYVASHRRTDTPAPGEPAHLFRFSYDPLLKTYSLDSGFPTTINNWRTETLTTAKDSLGTLWATWVQENQVYVNHTQGDDRTWGTPFALPAADSAVTSDDISAVIAFGGNKIGVMWDNQNDANEGFYFAVHDDAQPDSTWNPREAVIQGTHVADDHINLKADSSGSVYAAVKTDLTAASSPATMLVVRDPATGNWSSHTIDVVSNCPTRPIVLIDEQQSVVRVFETGPAPPSFTCSTSGGDIYQKDAPLAAISFPPGYGTPVMRDADSPFLLNVGSTKQTVTPSTDTVELAINTSTDRYWHAHQSTQPGTIVVKKDAIPDDPQDFDFSAGGGLSPASFQLDDDGDNTNALSDTRTFSGLAPGSGYSLAETVPAGWDQASATCDDGSSPSNVDVGPGETVTCTFVNSPRSYPNPKKATPVSASLVPAFQQCTSPNRIHGPSLEFGSCNPPAQASSNVTVGTRDANGSASNSVASLHFVVCPTTGCPAPDAMIIAKATDVRCKAGVTTCGSSNSTDGADYTGQLEGRVTLRITDKASGPSQTDPATLTDYALRFTISCSSSNSTSEGGRCLFTTTINTLVPGAVLSNKHTIVELDQLKIYDGGADGAASTTPNDLFMVQGVFVQ